MKDLDRQFDLTSRTALVTGASEGIGKGLALGLARAGADVILCSRREEKLKEVKAQIGETGSNCDFFVMDVSRESDIRSLKDFVQERFGKLDILVNNAGYAVTKPAWDVTEEDWNRMVDVGFKGLFFCCQILGVMMKDQGYGKIINLSSTFSRSIVKGRSVYAAIKAGISHLTEALAFEWAEDGIRVNALAPTAVMTPARKDALKGDLLKSILGRIPLGRLATTEDLVGCAVYLASPASDFVTGQTIFVDGGWIAGS